MTTDNEIVTTRVFEASQEKCWRAWAEPEFLAQWWGPAGFTNTFYTFEFKPGGIWDFVMHGPDGKNYKNTSRFEEIVKPRRLAFLHDSAPRYRGTAIFEDAQGKTRVFYSQVFEKMEPKFREFLEKANGQLFDRLGAVLEKMKEGI